MRKLKTTRFLFDREYVGELSFDLNEYDLIEDYGVTNLQVTTAIIMAILYDLSTVDHRLHIGEFSRNAIESEIIDLLTNAKTPRNDPDDDGPYLSRRLPNIDYKAIRGTAAELSTLPSIEPLYRTLKRAVRGLEFSPICVEYVHDNVLVTLTIL